MIDKKLARFVICLDVEAHDISKIYRFLSRKRKGSVVKKVFRCTGRYDLILEMESYEETAISDVKELIFKKILTKEIVDQVVGSNTILLLTEEPVPVEKFSINVPTFYTFLKIDLSDVHAALEEFRSAIKENDDVEIIYDSPCLGQHDALIVTCGKNLQNLERALFDGIGRNSHVKSGISYFAFVTESKGDEGDS